MPSLTPQTWHVFISCHGMFQKKTCHVFKIVCPVFRQNMPCFLKTCHKHAMKHAMFPPCPVLPGKHAMISCHDFMPCFMPSRTLPCFGMAVTQPGNGHPQKHAMFSCPVFMPCFHAIRNMPCFHGMFSCHVFMPCFGWLVQALAARARPGACRRYRTSRAANRRAQIRCCHRQARR